MVYFHFWSQVDERMGKPSHFKLHELANNGNEKELKKILRKKSIEINQLDDRHWTCLHCAANSRHIECCQLLLEHKADPHILTSTNNTALHFLVTIKGNPQLKEILRLMIKSKADVNYPTVRGFTPLHDAALRGGTSTVKFLVKNNALVNFRGNSYVTPLHCAIQLDFIIPFIIIFIIFINKSKLN